MLEKNLDNSNSKKYFDLWNKMEDYTDDEFKFLKKYIKNKNFKVHYGFYRKESSQGKQIALIIDTMANTRRTAVENNWDIIYTREMTVLEIEEYINFFFRQTMKRFWVYYYKTIDKLIEDDKILGAKTPDNFIEMCRKKGYSGPHQIKLRFLQD